MRRPHPGGIRDGRSLSVACGLESTASVEFSYQSLATGRSDANIEFWSSSCPRGICETVPVSPSDDVELSEEIEQEPLADCPPDSPRRIVDAWFVRVLVGHGDKARAHMDLQIAALQRTIVLDELIPSAMSCSGRAPRFGWAAQACTQGVEGYVSFRGETKDRLLRVSVTEGGVGKEDVTRVRPSVVLPCNTRVRWHPASVRDPAWTPSFQSTCELGCSDRGEACENNCLKRLTDDDGAYTNAGLDCSSRCSDRREACYQRCREAENQRVPG